MAIATETIQRLREQTGAGILDAKKALEEAGGNFDQAVDVLRKRGQKVAAKKQDRQASEGVVEAYIHGQGRVGVLLKLNCETDFVARTDQFKELAHQLAMHVAAFNPSYLSKADVPAEVVTREQAVHRELLTKEGKPAAVFDKIIAGKLQKFYSEVCLLEQNFLMDETKTVQALITERIAELGENIVLAEFKRMSL
ncbi:MAG: elongation factor Ts [Candidatus Kerfeldbacteria bacterium]|nr:elongation factor Ts [Candidatus Kerfeldbacteria bacterium]